MDDEVRDIQLLAVVKECLVEATRQGRFADIPGLIYAYIALIDRGYSHSAPPADEED